MTRPLSITAPFKQAFALTHFTRQAYSEDLFHGNLCQRIEDAATLLTADSINLIKTGCNAAIAATAIGVFAGASGIALPYFVLTAMRTSVAFGFFSLLVQREGANQAAQQTLSRLQTRVLPH